MTAIPTFAVYAAAALAEIAGCFAVWAWMRLGASALWLLPGLVSLAAFAWALTLAPSDFAGRAFAAYGGVYITASLVWLWAIEGQLLDPVFLRARQTAALTGITFGLLTPDAKTVRRTAKLRRDRLVGGRIAGVIAAVLSKKPNTAFTEFGWIRGGESLLCHRAHPWSVLLSGKPGAVQSGKGREYADWGIRDFCEVKGIIGWGESRGL